MRLLALLVLAIAIGVPAQADKPATIAPQMLQERLAWADRALVVLDVRTEVEYAAGHVPGAINIPHTELAARLAELEAARSSDIVVYCQSGRRSQLALTVLGEAGFSRRFQLQGDYPGWSADHPVVTPAL